MVRHLVSGLVVVVLALGACAGSDETASPTVAPTTTAATTSTTVAPTTTTTAPTPMPNRAQLEGIALKLAPIVELAEPVGMAWRKGDPALYVIGRRGQVWRMFGDQMQGALVLDLGARVSDGAERGLLGIAFDPRDGRMFLDYTDLDGHTHVVSWVVQAGVADPASERELLVQLQPGPGHNGGHLAFDWKGNLFIGFGDGGGSNGRDAQNLTNMLGSIVRVLPNLDAPGYTIPPDNPFAGRSDVRPEILVYGLRNPWRFSLDPPTKSIWLGDVGNDDVEEVDRVTFAEWGRNYGWYFFEGTRARYNTVPADTVPPVFEYTHDTGVAAVGGYVYRGDAIPELRGAYVFGDLGGPVWLLGTDGVVQQPFRVSTLVSFATDPNGELYVISMKGTISRIVRA